MTDMKKYMEIQEEVADALNTGKPVVALESTIISHGMPYPVNVQTAREVEAIVREEGAVPATIAILGGRIQIGLNDEHLEYLGRPENRDSIAKVSRRDLAYVLSHGQNGATTVAATMICAQMAGIEVFVTGGIGGVHRGAEQTMDISSRPHRTCANECGCRLRRGEVYPRSWLDARIPGDTRCTRRRLQNATLPRVLRSHQRVSG